MKSIKELAWNVDEETYRKDSAISYSTIASFVRKGWRDFLKEMDEDLKTPSLRFGSLVDTLLTEPESFDEKFLEADFPTISDKVAKIIRDIWEDTGGVHPYLEDIDDESIIKACDRESYYTNYKAKTRIDYIRSGGSDYYNLLALARDKEIVSSEEVRDARACVDELRTNEFTKAEFMEYPLDPYIETLYQIKFKSEFNNIPLRNMFDRLIVDHRNKTIRPIDLKTSGHYEELFDSSFIKWNYYIQSQLYVYSLMYNLLRDDYFKDFLVLPFRFVVINRITKSPITYEFFPMDNINLTLLDMIDSSGKVYTNWSKVITDLKWYLDNPTTRYSKETIENNGVMKIKELRLLQ